MKITQVMLTKGFGGAERYFTDLSIVLAGRDHHIQVICNKHFRELERFRNMPGITMETLNVMGWWDPVARYRIKQAIKEFSPDVVHAHLARAAYIAGNAIKDLNIPLVVKTHNYVNLKYYRNVSCFIATTNDQRRHLLDKNVSDEKIIVIPNFSLFPGVDKIKPPNQNHVVFASYGRMVNKKGFDVLLKAFRVLANSGINASLKLGGDGPEMKTLQLLSKKLELDKLVTFHGWIKDVRSFLADADIFVLPSLDEPFGIAILEAMSCGVPIIATNTRGPMEILDKDMACFVQAGDVASLAAMMNHMVSNREAASVMAQRCLEKYKSEYSGKVVIPKIEALYNKLCHKPS